MLVEAYEYELDMGLLGRQEVTIAGYASRTVDLRIDVKMIQVLFEVKNPESEDWGYVNLLLLVPPAEIERMKTRLTTEFINVTSRNTKERGCDP